MPRKSEGSLIPAEVIERRILLIRGQKVMLDFDLAALYEVPTFRLNEAVKRNRKRFRSDFMFQLTKAELENWRSQFAISNPGTKMGLRRPPYAFTEHGVAMLSSVLNSERAIAVNIAIIRTFVRLRQILAEHREIAERLDQIEKKYDRQFKAVFDILRQLMTAPEATRPSIGFVVHEHKKK